MEGIDWGSQVAREVMLLNKTHVVKRLTVAVRTSQGAGTNGRACWAPSERPDWWLPEHKVKHGLTESVSLPFVSQGKQYWAVDSARVTLLLYEFRIEIGEAMASSHPAETQDLSEPEHQIVPEPRLEPDVNDEEVGHAVQSSDPEPQDEPQEPQDKHQEPQDEYQVPEDEEPQAEKPIQLVDESELDPEVRKKMNAELAALDKRFAADMVIWKKECNDLKKDVINQNKTDTGNLRAQFRLYRIKNIPREVEKMKLVDYIKDYSADAHEYLMKHIEATVEQVHNDEDLEDSGQSSKTPTNNYVQSRRDEVTATVRKTARNARKRKQNATPSAAMTRTRPIRLTARKAMDENRAILQSRKAVASSSATEPVAATPPPTRRNMQVSRRQRDRVATVLQTVQMDRGKVPAETYLAEQIRRRKEKYTKALELEEMELARLKEAEKRIEAKRLERERLKEEIETWETATRQQERRHPIR